MPKRKQSEAQLANLEKGKCYFDKETARTANKLSQEAKKRYRPLKEVAKESISPEDWAAIVKAMKQLAKSGGVREAEFLLTAVGEKRESVALETENEIAVNIRVVE